MFVTRKDYRPEPLDDRAILFSGVGWLLTNNLSYERINLMLSTPFLFLQRYGDYFNPPNLFQTFFTTFREYLYLSIYKKL